MIWLLALVALVLMVGGCAVGGSTTCDGQRAEGSSQTTTIAGGLVVIEAKGGRCEPRKTE